MSHSLDKLLDLLSTPTDRDLDGDVDATIAPEDPIELARYQLASTRSNFWEGPTGVFHGCGNRFGCGYAEATATVDPHTGYADLRIATHLYVAPEHRDTARKLCRRLNQDFVIPGLAIEDDGQLVFATERPHLLLNTELDELLGKGFSTVHRHAHMVAQINAGVAPWNILPTID